MERQTDMQSAYQGQIQAGWTVYGSDGEKIGDVAGGGGQPGAQYFMVEKGFLFPTELYIPFSAITRVDDEDGNIHLNVPKDQIEEQGWSQPPAADYDTGARADTDEAVAGYRERAGTEGETIERREEQLRVDKEPVEAGEVHVGKHVVEQEQSVDVPVTREEVHVERRPVDRPAGDASLQNEDVSVPVREERVVADKEARVVEEMDVEKTARQDTERVTDTVRKEEFDVDTEADAERNR